jgi:hypothetical protein
LGSTDRAEAPRAAAGFEPKFKAVRVLWPTPRDDEADPDAVHALGEPAAAAFGVGDDAGLDVLRSAQVMARGIGRPPWRGLLEVKQVRSGAHDAASTSAATLAAWL